MLHRGPHHILAQNRNKFSVLPKRTARKPPVCRQAGLSALSAARQAPGRPGFSRGDNMTNVQTLYCVRKRKLGRQEALDRLSIESGRVYAPALT
jgi:hypothetical protein